MPYGFDFAIPFTLHHEGGYTPGLPDDPGGETRWGISHRSYPTLDLKTLTREAAIAIYRRDFWDALHLDLLPLPLAVALFDGAVNQGPGAARGFIRDLQGLLGMAPDGIIGPATAAACEGKDLARLLRRLCVIRAIRYTGAGNFATYDQVWLDRLLSCFDYCEGIPR